MESSDKSKEGYLEGQLLVATPQIRYSCFARSVIYMCVHNANGAMGLIINQTLEEVDNAAIWKYFKIKPEGQQIYMPIHFGGPVDSARGFILHGADYRKHHPLHVKNGLAVSSNVDILKDIASGSGPENKLFILGYAGWAPGQLETEIEANSWISVPAKKELVFGTDNASKWQMAAKSAGVDLYKLSHDVGHA